MADAPANFVGGVAMGAAKTVDHFVNGGVNLSPAYWVARAGGAAPAAPDLDLEAKLRGWQVSNGVCPDSLPYKVGDYGTQAASYALPAGEAVAAIRAARAARIARLAELAMAGERTVAATPAGRPYSAHYLTDTGPSRNIPGTVVDETIDHGQVAKDLADRTVFYDPANDMTVVLSKTTGKIMSARRGTP